MSCHVLFNRQPQTLTCMPCCQHASRGIYLFLFPLVSLGFFPLKQQKFPTNSFSKKYKHANFVPKAFKKLGQQKVVFWTNRHPWLGLGWPDLHQFNAPTSNVYKGSVPTPNVCNITSNICKGSANTISNVCNITSNICKCSTNVTSNVYIFKCCRWPFSSAVQYQLQCL